jgi:hypothetical protein
MNALTRRIFTALLALALVACAAQPVSTAGDDGTFTIAVIPDTQNYVDYRHQRKEGFVLDGKDLFIAQMKDIAARDDVVFVAAVGDVWQHSSVNVDPAHEARGKGEIDNPMLKSEPTPKTWEVEIPGAIEGYQILAASGKPFGVAPGNHDYDAFWSIRGFPPRTDTDELNRLQGDAGVLHVGGLNNFRAVFGEDSEFFAGKPWYVDSFRGGANAAQVFAAGGYRFLHITFEMSPGDPVLRWAESVIEAHPGYPTIITTHDYLNARGERRGVPIIDLALGDPDHHNNAEAVWSKLVSAYDQIFMVLCGHHYGQSLRIDDNRYGNPVYQVLADYQVRGQAGVDAGGHGGSGVVGLGDGWYRLMRFDLAAETPTVTVETWSSHYRSLSGDMPQYADWYKGAEQPDMSDEEFYAADAFTLELSGFRDRFEKRPD